MMDSLPGHPDWDRLYEVAAAQQGMFTTKQAAEAGYSPQLLIHHTRAGKFARVRRGIYRVVHFPIGEHEDLIAAWLWSAHAGVVSHQTALGLHGLSDVLPSQLHLTVPAAWRHRRIHPPPDVVLHYVDLAPEDRAWFGGLPLTAPRRTLRDCAEADLSPELLRQAARQALRRGLVARSDLGELDRALAPFGGLGT